MAIKDRIIEIAYRLKDEFSNGIGKLTGSFRKFEREAGRSSEVVEGKFNRLKESFSGIGATLGAVFSGALVAAGVRLRRFADEADRLAKTGRKLGVTTAELSKLQYAAKLSGVESNKLSLGLQRMARRVAEAAQGTGEAKNALLELNLSAKDLNKLSPDKQFLAIADAISKIPNQTDRVRLGFKLFDSEGVDLINTMNEGAEGIKRLGEELEAMGGVLDDKAAKSAEEFNDQLTRMNANIDGLVNKYGPEVLGLLSSGIELFDPNAENTIGAINSRLDELFERQQQINDGWYDNIFATAGIDKAEEIKYISDQIVRLIQKRAILSKSSNLETKETKDLESANNDLAKSYKTINTAFDSTLSRYNSAATALKNAKKEAQDVAKEFDNLKASMRDDSDELATHSSVQAEITRAQKALHDGDTDGALDAARDGAKLLENLKEQGKTSTIVLEGLAGMLGHVAKEAAKEQTTDELTDYEREAAKLDELAAKKRDLVEGPIEIKFNADATEAEQAMAAIPDEKIIKIRYQVIGGVPTFGDSFGKDITKEAMKRGKRQ